MCRNIRTLFNFEPPAEDAEIQAAALQYVRKVSGFTAPSVANQAAFDRAVANVAIATATLIQELHSSATPKNREIEAERAKSRSLKRFG